MSQEATLLADDTGEGDVETPELTPETEDVAPPETEAEQEESTESTEEATDEVEAEEEEPSITELLAREDLSTEELDRLAEKYPGLKKQLDWKQDQARDSERQRAQADAAKRQKQNQAHSYASGQVAQQLSQYLMQAADNGDELSPQQIQGVVRQAAQAVDQYHFQQAYANVASAINSVAPEGAQIPQKMQDELRQLGDKIYTGEATTADWVAKRLQAFGEQYVEAKKAELRKQWEKEQAEKQKARKDTERLKDADSKRKGVSPTTTQGTPGGDNPESILTSSSATPEQRRQAFQAIEGFDLAEVFPEMR